MTLDCVDSGCMLRQRTLRTSETSLFPLAQNIKLKLCRNAVASLGIGLRGHSIRFLTEHGFDLGRTSSRRRFGISRASAFFHPGPPSTIDCLLGQREAINLHISRCALCVEVRMLANGLTAPLIHEWRRTPSLSIETDKGGRTEIQATSTIHHLPREACNDPRES